MAKQKTKPALLVPNSGLQRAYRFKDLTPYTGLKRTRLAELIKAKQFPEGVRVNDDGRTKIWFENVLIKWQAGRGGAS